MAGKAWRDVASQGSARQARRDLVWQGKVRHGRHGPARQGKARQANGASKLLTLRQFQSDLVTKTIAAIRAGKRRILLVLPTGGGKTVIASRIVTGAADKGNTAFFLVHRTELAEQAVRTFEDCGVLCGMIVSGGQIDSSKLVHVAMAATLARRAGSFVPPKILIIDEAHHAVAPTLRKILDECKESIVIGLTATPQRLDGRGLGEMFEEMVIGPSPSWLIQNGYLARFRAFSPRSGIGEDGLAVRSGDFAIEDIEHAMDRPTVTGDAIAEYSKLIEGKRAIVFCASISHSTNVATAFSLAGFPAEHVDGKTPKEERRAIMDRFRTGKTLVLCNVDLFAEGVDVPDAVGVILLAHTLSLGKYLQRVGRCLRMAPGKVACIIDHVGSIRRHGLPTDEREWSLDSKRRASKSVPETKLVQCMECDQWFPPARVCPGCGFVVPVKERLRFLRHVPGELVEVIAVDKKTEEENKQAAISMRKKAKTLADLRLIETKRGYKRGWAEKVFNGRKSKQLSSNP
ncbi:MAG: DEAD/DEAH box helicase [Magnetococcales bacterium]|nr:DEAD/DEAH box helicase [Magnetococcales bacterium]